MPVIIEELPEEQDATTQQQEEDTIDIPPSSSEEWVHVNKEDSETQVENDASKTESNSKDAQESDLNNEQNENDAKLLAEAEELKTSGNSFFAEGQLEEALDKYIEALEKAPLSATKQRAIYHANKAACYMRMDDAAQAVDECTEALELDPGYTKALLRRSSAYEGLEEYELALKDAQSVLEQDPENTTAKGIVTRVEPIVLKKQEEMKEEMIGKLKDLGNSLLGKFGMSLDNFKAEKDPQTGSYSIKFQQ